MSKTVPTIEKAASKSTTAMRRNQLPFSQCTRLATASGNRANGPRHLFFSGSLRFTDRMRAESVGMTVTDTSNDNVTAATIASEMSAKSCPASSSTSRIGMNTATVVKVDASTAPKTSRPPSTAARIGALPISRCLYTFSSTTIALSTTMPTANAIPARLMTLIDRPSATIATIAPTTEIGIASAMMPAVRSERRNNNKMKIASPPPIQMLFCTSDSASSM